ncbi:MAG: sulfotransferase [Desulfobulbaceae bacterium]|nr:sulfotransferase [Desulfobulbaceae bacterium]
MKEKLDALKYKLKSPFLDIGRPEESILLIGMGRSGTTWAADIINHDKSYRILFEPFFPSLVNEAKDFAYIQYMNPADNRAALAAGAQKILAGKTRSQWVDRDNKGILYRRRIIKDIRSNLMAGWLKKLAPRLPVIQLIRHPLQVACSWRKLGWGEEALGERSDFDIIMSQHRLLEDFPIIKKIVQKINPDNFLDNVIFLWGVMHLVPLDQFPTDKVYRLFYEHLLINPEAECKKLFYYLHKEYSWDNVKETVNRKSSTNFQNRNLSQDKNLLLHGWKKELTGAEIERADEILSMFGLEGVYDADGLPAGKEYS